MNTTLATLSAPGVAAGPSIESTAPIWRAVLQAVVGALRRPAAATEGSAVLDAAREAAAVRELAHRYRRSDPGFASDLYAAADRHERAFDRTN